jgi:hypothetical protein
MPDVVARIGIDRDPIHVTAADDARWLRACLPPDQPGRLARLDEEMALAATTPPLLLPGDAVELLADAIASVPCGLWERRWLQVVMAGRKFPGEWPDIEYTGMAEDFVVNEDDTV